MSTGVTQEFKEQFLKDKCYYDSLSQAIKLAKTNDCEEKLIKPLLTSKQEYKTICADNNAKLLKSMTLSQNTVHLEGSWYAVRYVNDKGDTALKIDIINEKDIGLLKRDGRHERELSRSDIDNLLPALINESALELYKQQLLVRASDLVRDYCGVVIDVGVTQEEVDANKPITVSSHAGIRWIQRKIGIKDKTKAEDYRRHHYNEINEAVLESFDTAELVWTSEDGIEYWFDEDNMMYVVGNHNIITLYEEDFGFTKDINRMITFEQLEVLNQAHEALQEAIDEQSNNMSSVEREITSINDEMATLQARMDLLSSSKATLISERDQLGKKVSVVRSEFNAEFNKLFKKWDA